MATHRAHRGLLRLPQLISVLAGCRVKQLWHLVLHAPTIGEQQMMLIVLGLIDVVMISNLLVMVIVGGYETFVSRLHLKGHPAQPERLDHVNASVLKIGIASIRLLRTTERGTPRRAM